MNEPKRETLRQLLGRQLQIEIVDGRIFTGTFVCTDQRCNIVLDHVVELQPASRQLRDVGLIMISPEHLVKIKARDRDLRPQDQDV